MIEQCQRCGNYEDGDDVFYCWECGTHFCDACLGNAVGGLERWSAGVVYSSFCPECEDGGWIGRVDRIGTVDEPIDEDGEEDGDDPDDGSTWEDWDTSSSGDEYGTGPDDSPSPYVPSSDGEAPSPRPTTPPDPKQSQLLAAAGMSESRLDHEIQLRVLHSAGQGGPFSGSTVPLVTSDELIHLVVMGRDPLPRILWFAERYGSGGRPDDWLARSARLIIEARMAKDPLVNEAVVGLRAEGNLDRWGYSHEPIPWSLSDYVKELQRVRREREDAEAEVLREEERLEAEKRASAPQRQVLRLAIVILGAGAVILFVCVPVIVGRAFRLFTGPHWTTKWLDSIEAFLLDMKTHLTIDRVSDYIRTGQE